MRIVLFCENRYAIDILQPLACEAERQGGHVLLWYINTAKIREIPIAESARWTSSMQEIYDFAPDAIYAPGNIVPYYLPGVKVQIFHGYAAEKKDQFRIRHYFDLYFTQGPYFTREFLRLQEKHGDFEVYETGWTKQDWIKRNLHSYDDEKQKMLTAYHKNQVVLYAPTFSPRLTSLPYMKQELTNLLSAHPEILLIMKFHPLTKTEWCDEYRLWAQQHGASVIYVDASENVTKYQMMSDVMISDTSSTVYEFLLLDRPVITLRSIAKDIYWENIDDEKQLLEAYDRALNDEDSKMRRLWVINNYDPHIDGKCCMRMLDKTEYFITRYGVPKERKLNIWRKYTCIKTFGWINR